MKYLLLTFTLFSALTAGATDYYCAPAAKGTGQSADKPGEFTTLVKALKAGDRLVCAGGQYDYTSQITIAVSGTAAKPITICAAEGQTPAFDFRRQPYGKTGIAVSGSHLHVIGLTIRYAGKNGLHNTGGYNTFELLDVYGCGDTGVQMKGPAGHNLILNCDSHDNFDYKLDKSGNLTQADFGGNADGFADKQYTGEGNTYRGCRSYRNSDDGWDCYQRKTQGQQTVIENCICYQNGPEEYDMRNHPRYAVDKAWFDKFKTPVSVTMRQPKDYSTGKDPTVLVSLEHYVNNGNANGFKMGGDYTKHNFMLCRTLSVANNGRGIDQNNNDGVMLIYNNSTYDNLHNIGLNNAKYGTATLYNNVSLATREADQLQCKQTTASHNTWDTAGQAVSAADFLSLDTTAILAPRQADGSLPDIPLMRLTKGSTLIDAGIAVQGVAYSGSAPDLGAFEYEETDAVNRIEATPTNGQPMYNALGESTDRTTGLLITKGRALLIRN